MAEQTDREVMDLVSRQFELDPGREIQSEEELLDLLTEQVHYMIAHKLDFLLSLMYRLDVEEGKINQVLDPGYPLPADRGLAILILERQKQRIQTRNCYKSGSGDFWNS